MIELNKIIHADCMDVMADIPDKYFELAIVDPPYGIGADAMNLRNGGKKYKKNKKSKWDNNIPDGNYFRELFRISKDQIIWGGNYFAEKLKSFRCFLIWNKMHGVGVDFADCELAWTSFDKVAKRFDMRPMNMDNGKIHPTQKPVALYRWILQNYAKPGDKIIDTHSGSGSLACACHIEKFDFLAIEKDIDYYHDSVKRLDELRTQGVLF